MSLRSLPPVQSAGFSLRKTQTLDSRCLSCGWSSFWGLVSSFPKGIKYLGLSKSLAKVVNMTGGEAPTSERLSWLGSATSLLAVMTCYGTLAAVALLSLVGVSVDLSEGLLIKIITGLLVVALLGMTYSFRLHRSPGPLVLSVAAAGLLVWVFYGTYSHVL